MIADDGLRRAAEAARASNGRTDPGRRAEAVLRALAGEEPGAVARAYGTTPASLARWRERFLEGGRDALTYQRRDRGLRVSLRERVKELSCLYGISQAANRQGIPLDTILSDVVALLPPAWQYPAVASARLVLDGRTYATEGFADLSTKQAAEVVVAGIRRGCVEVAYSEPRQPRDEGPFLKEERDLLDEVARKIAFVVAHAEKDEERFRLEVQLLHADRLATIGQLAAGVAHELNEPLAAVLGFAQLGLKAPGLPPETARDLQRIQAAALHAREVVRKLLLFARQNPPRKSRVDLNRLVDEGLYVLSSRCAKSGIHVVRTLAPGLPAIVADPTQIQQVLVNLVVNAIQAMPAGGTLTLGTSFDGTDASVVVEDTGIGMTPEIRRQAFVPFFTTKDVGEGTGLGLSVVHGIVTAHGGTIRLESEVGGGTRFEIRLPVNGRDAAAGEA